MYFAGQMKHLNIEGHRLIGLTTSDLKRSITDEQT